MSKGDLRKEFLERRLNLPAQLITETSTLISARLLALPLVQNASALCGYLPFRNEVDLRSAYDIFFQKHPVYFPKFENERYFFVPITHFSELTKGRYGILEPKTTQSALSVLEAKDVIDLWIVPLVAFDKRCNRLGYGGGYYDQFLSGARGKSLGIAFEFQKTDNLIREEHDITLSAILTEDHFYTV